MIDYNGYFAIKDKAEHEYGMSVEELFFAGILCEYFPMAELIKRDGKEEAENYFNKFANQMYTGYKNAYVQAVEEYLNPMILDPIGFKKVCLSGDAFSSTGWMRVNDAEAIGRYVANHGIVYDLYYDKSETL